jgi:hypothetical protein
MKIASAIIVATILMLALVIQTSVVEASEHENIRFSMNETSTTTEKIVDVDYQARTVTLQGDSESYRTVKVSDSVSNFNQIKKGDSVTMKVNQTMTVEVQPGPGYTLNVGSESQTSEPPGQKPAGVRTIEGKLKTRVEAINYEARTIRCKNRHGKMMTYRIGKDVTRFSEIRRGDMLVVEYAQTIAVSVK